MTAPTLSLAGIDARLGELRAVVERVGSELLTLDTDPIRQLLDTSGLTGTSASGWAAAAEQLGRLWQGHASLSALLGEATELRGNKRRISGEELARLETLLFGPVLPAPGGGPSSTALRTVEEVVAELSAMHESVAATVARATTVWEEVLPRLGELDTTLLGAETRARVIGARIPNEVVSVRRQLQVVCDRALGDPLSVDLEQADVVSGVVARARDAILETIAAFEALGTTATTLVDELDTIAGLLSDATAAAEESQAKLARWRGPADDLRLAEDHLHVLRSELDGVRIAPATGAGPGAPVDAAVRRVESLRRRVDALLDEAQQLATACGSGLAARAELRGRLEAYRARAASSGRGEDLELDRLHREAQAALYSAPCDLRAAGNAVALYTDAVRSASRPGGR